MRGRAAKTAAAACALLGALAPAAHAAVSFAPFQPYPASAPTAVAAGDFNGDGKRDMATASTDTNIVSTLLGNGDGTFQAPLNTPAAAHLLTAIAAADLNADGRDDLVVTESNVSDQIRVYLSNADGTFADPPALYPVGDDPQDVSIGRINGDAAPDVAVANQLGHNYSIFLNDGSGALVPGLNVAAPGGGDGLGVEIADFDGDTKGDLAISQLNGAPAGVSFLSGNGDGTFNTATTPAGPNAQKLSAGDLNGDGRTDLVADRPANGDVAIFVRGTSAFDAPTFFDPDGGSGNNSTPALGDLDGDGVLDLAVPNQNGASANTVSIGLGTGNGTFTAAGNVPVAAKPFWAAIGDFNRDGNADVVTSADTSNSVSVLLANPPTMTVTGSLAFGEQPLGVQTAEQTIGVTNNGPQRLHPGTVALGGANASDFAVSTNTCTGASVATGAACIVGVKFTPGGNGARSATLSIPSNAGGSPQVVTLSGSGPQPPPPPPGLLPGRCANLKTGTAVAETLTGTALGDRLLGLGGNDVLNGLAGDDCLTGGRGNDRLNGGAGKDTIKGDAGKDIAGGGNGADALTGGAGNDRLSGGAANDKLTGSSGNDRLTGGAGKNRYSGGAGKDTISARNKVRETIDCGAGRDVAVVDRRDKVKRNCERVKRR
jgi:Ca2+-binding RTX toxin-like protein